MFSATPPRFSPGISPRNLLVGVVVSALFVLGGGRAIAAPGLPLDQPGQQAVGASNGFRTLTGAAAAGFTVPADMELVRSLPLSGYGLTYERYQQVAGPERAEVLGAQLAVYRAPSGTPHLVIGRHLDAPTARNSVRLGPAMAAEAADRDVGSQGRRTVDLVLDPGPGRYLFRVETQRLDSRWFHFVDAETGAVVDRYDALAQDHGTGVKNDSKDLNGPNNADPADDLTSFHGAAGHGAAGAHWDLFSNDGRQSTYDAHDGGSQLFYTTDADNHWTLVTADRGSPGQPALIDAQYYANVTDDYYLARHGLDWLTCHAGGMQSVGHFVFKGNDTNNAAWTGTYFVYGDGDGTAFREFSGALDVVAHELSHGVTDCTSQLIYQDESGALNESFSDQMGTAAEFYAAEPTSSNCVLVAGQATCPDWWISEDISLLADTAPGFRNMKDPEEDGDPDHYTERQVGGGDSGGVHTNSGIPNHAFYLLVNGGLNASCVGSGTHASAHCSDGDTQDNNLNVAGIGLTKAERIVFVAYTGLSSDATMCEARAASEAAATSLYGAAESLSAKQAWVAVGLTDIACGLAPPPTPTPTPTPGGTPTPTPTPGPTPTPTPTPPPGSGATYVGLTPSRILDSRFGNGLSGAFGVGAARSFQVTGRGGVPAGAVAVTGNLTVTGQTAGGWLTLGPVAATIFDTSTLNFPVNDNRANGVTVQLGTGGILSLVYFGAPGGSTTHAIFDVTGYFIAGGSGATYVGLTPSRILDSRFGNGLSGAFGVGAARSFQVTGRGGVPAGAVAVTGNLTVTGQTAGGWLTLGPVAATIFDTSTLNFPVNDNRANGVTVQLGTGGILSLVYFGAPGGSTTHAIFDVTGYFIAGGSGATYVGLTPSRILDSRFGNGLSGAFGVGAARSFQVTGRGGVPAGAVAVTGNLTVTGQTAGGWLTLGPVAATIFDTSTLNFPVNDNRANGVTVQLGTGGILSLVYFGAPGGSTTHAIFDVTGYFMP